MKEKKKIAIICFEMIPYSVDWGGMQRVYYYANYLTNNFAVSVIASKNTSRNNLFERSCKFEVIHFPNKFQKIGIVGNQEYSVIKKIKGQFISRVKAILKPVVKILNNIIFNELSVGVGPNSYLWIKTNKMSIINYVARNKITHIIISVPPFGLLSPDLINILKKNINGKLIIDYRDPWNCSNGSKGISFHREQKIIKASDTIIVTNNKHRYKLIKDFKIPEEKVKVIMNGYDGELWRKVDKNHDYGSIKEKLIISYVGNISFKNDSFRNPSNFLKASVEFRKKYNILIRFIGLNFQTQELEELRYKYPEIEFIPKVTQQVSFQYMLESTVLLSFHTVNNESAKYLIGGKIFDYYRSHRPILSINSKDSYECEFIKENDLGYCVINDIQQIRNILNRIYIDWNKGKGLFSRMPLSNIKLEQFSRNKQNEKFLTLL